MVSTLVIIHTHNYNDLITQYLVEVRTHQKLPNRIKLYSQHWSNVVSKTAHRSIVLQTYNLNLKITMVTYMVRDYNYGINLYTCNVELKVLINDLSDTHS